MSEERKPYLKENDELLKCLLNNRFFNVWRDTEARQKTATERVDTLLDDTALEIYITSQCNQSCEYCYLVKHRSKLYPQECDKPEIILHNLDILLDWIIENDFCIPRIEIFTGEIWQSQFGLEVLEKLYQAVLRGLMTNCIMIPSNCSFLRSERQTGLIERYIKKFRQFDIILSFSISVDGAPIEKMNRPFVDGSEKEDDFYERMFLFAKANNFYFHPMVSAHSVKYWIDNHKWWVENCRKYDINPDQCIMMLEVRNDEWTEESIADYNKFMNYLIDRFLNEIGSVKDFCDLLLAQLDKKIDYITGYVPYLIGEADSFAGCTVSTDMVVRLGDMAICPCHRTCYDKYIYGHFVVEDDKITDIISNNIYMAQQILFGNQRICALGCDTCTFNFGCLKGCYGAQLEANNDPMIPAVSVCEFFKGKYTNLINKYEEIGVWDELRKTSPYSVGYLLAQDLLKFRDKVEKEYGLGKN